MSATSTSFRMSLGNLSNLVKHPVPPRSREEVHEHRAKAFQRRASAFVLVVLASRLVRPVDDERLALDVLARQEAPVSAVLRVVAIVTHDEVLARGDGHRTVAIADVEGGDLAKF